MNEDQIEGGLNNMAGKVEGAAGGLLGDTKTQVSGKMREAAGQAQNMYGDVVEEVKSYAAENPMNALLGAMGLGVILGIIIARR